MRTKWVHVALGCAAVLVVGGSVALAPGAAPRPCLAPFAVGLA